MLSVFPNFCPALTFLFVLSLMLFYAILLLVFGFVDVIDDCCFNFLPVKHFVTIRLERCYINKIHS